MVVGRAEEVVVDGGALVVVVGLVVEVGAVAGADVESADAPWPEQAPKASDITTSALRGIVRNKTTMLRGPKRLAGELRSLLRQGRTKAPGLALPNSKRLGCLCPLRPRAS